jgi:cardiolipin synthase
LLVQVGGVASAAHAVMNVRSSRGAVAWSISLVTFPWVTIPLYWVFGRNQFQGYAEALRGAFGEHQDLVRQAYQELRSQITSLPERLAPLEELADRLAAIPFTSGNHVELLIDGEETFTAMLTAIEAATDYILLQTYILSDDQVGNAFRRALIEKAQQGVKVHLLYDGIGTRRLSRMYRRSLARSGVQTSVFKSTKGKWNRWQVNFRNHRKILIVDGAIAFVGGFNIADEYMGYKSPLSPWRDTHLRVRGAAVQCLQGCFLGDWYWATREVLDANWDVKPSLEVDQTAFVLPTGPADRLPNCILFFVNAVNQATERLWLASPYFVPDDSFLTALKLAAIRGVDVRILLPSRPDHFWVYYCAFSYYKEMQTAGVKFYRYQPGFLHQKVMLIDNTIASVGTVNLDNRSFFLNFEASVFVTSQSFIQDVEQMLLADLKECLPVETSEEKEPLWLRFIARVARLLSPVL